MGRRFSLIEVVIIAGMSAWLAMLIWGKIHHGSCP